MNKKHILQEIRPTLRHKCNLELLDYLTGFADRRTATVIGKRYLHLLGKTERDSMFLPLGSRHAPGVGFNASAELLEFYSAFDGLREEKPPTAGNFIAAAEIVSAAKVLEPEDFPAFKKYAKCPIVFEATNGDQMLQTADGKFVWCVVSEGRAKKAADSFAQLIKRYVKYRVVGDGQPFDSYGR